MTKVEDFDKSEEVWAEVDNFVGTYYSISFKDSVDVPVNKESDSFYRVASGVLLVKSQCESEREDDFIVTAGEAVTIKKGKRHTFSAINGKRA